VILVERRGGEADKIESDKRTREEITGWYHGDYEYGKDGR